MTDVQGGVQSVEKFQGEVDVGTVWCSDGCDYEWWICQLLCRLIGSGGVRDELFQLLSPVCHIKVLLLSPVCHIKVLLLSPVCQIKVQLLSPVGHIKVQLLSPVCHIKVLLMFVTYSA